MRLHFFKDLREDRRRCGKENTDEQKALSARFFSWYRGVPVIRTRMKRSGFFGAIFLKRDILGVDPADELRHEYGHVLQRRKLSFFSYLFHIFWPSVRTKSDGGYYEKPWEITADILGGVRSRSHAPGDAARGFAYLDRAKRR